MANSLDKPSLESKADLLGLITHSLPHNNLPTDRVNLLKMSHTGALELHERLSQLSQYQKAERLLSTNRDDLQEDEPEPSLQIATL